MNTQHLKALDLADAGDWHGAHGIVQKLNDSTACWIHANLHREEGDIGNADYWYQQAGSPRPSTSTSAEREAIRKALA
ncbi:MAG: hypothetical protein QGH15_04510 [Kiritimatiellia bacterium]|jgi:hypothetical protein|nr:hypothetical protein [Kiritimatiellia bacterium]